MFSGTTQKIFFYFEKLELKFSNGKLDSSMAPNKAPPGLRVPSSELSPSLVRARGSSELSPSLVRVPSKEERKTDQTVAVPS